MEAMDERERFAAMFAAYWKPVLGFAARRCSTPADASDVAAEVFLVAWRRHAEIPAGDEARMWLYGVARRALANHRRGEMRRDRLGQALLDAWTDASDADPADLFAARDAVVTVRHALATLRPIDADLLTLTAWEGLTTAQAAGVVGIRADAARTRIFRARRTLRRRLAQIPGPDTALTALTMEARS
jgi:RNA polymerase sigma-70 factor (ECF subfamily)